MSFPAKFPPMRPQLELQRVHDLLDYVLSDARLMRMLLPPEQVRPLMLVADCLCWALHHEHPGAHGPHFAAMINDLRKDLAVLVPDTADEPPPEGYIIEE